ncbi:MAG: riboflavin biosynthesis protein RibF [Bacteroidetes bacterium]|uniref:Riboflavin biosynthesis protein n=1 Tax=Candidatus Merdivivens pullicola TaxID=2840872 RepID=A0A9D9NGS1_9BACT|nr:riboflavin biosynthesis protein RibF [Candidatus Merdivivens pullicola]
MVVATGFFDGVHIGHRAVVSALCRIAHERGEKSMIVTFWPHPRTVLRQDAAELRLLTSLDEKKRMLYALGVDEIEVIDFTKDFSTLSAEAFIRDYLIGRFGATALVLGYDHRLGGGSPMTREELESLVQSLGLDTYRLGEEDFDGKAVSSTAIRKLLASGDVERANGMLGYSYSLCGVVVAGNRLGREIGFPTANIELYEPLKLLPADGAYAVEADVEGRTYYGMTNIGRRPTVSSISKRTIETNIFDFSSDIYGLDVCLRFIGRIRGEMKFSSIDMLRSRLAEDKGAAERIISEKRLTR